MSTFDRIMAIGCAATSSACAVGYVATGNLTLLFFALLEAFLFFGIVMDR